MPCAAAVPVSGPLRRAPTRRCPCAERVSGCKGARKRGAGKRRGARELSSATVAVNARWSEGPKAPFCSARSSSASTSICSRPCGGLQKVDLSTEPLRPDGRPLASRRCSVAGSMAGDRPRRGVARHLSDAKRRLRGRGECGGREQPRERTRRRERRPLPLRYRRRDPRRLRAPSASLRRATGRGAPAPSRSASPPAPLPG